MVLKALCTVAFLAFIIFRENHISAYKISVGIEFISGGSGYFRWANDLKDFICKIQD